jgi:hypothetical protein
MPTANLFDDGWRQGSLIREHLIARTYDLVEGSVAASDTTNDVWFLATQDCDLAQTKVTNATRTFELRPLYQAAADDRVDGIRARTVRVTDDLVLRSDSPRLTITARALDRLRDRRENPLSDERRRELKTWLGLRYDRPAVPRPFEHLPAVLQPELMEAVPDALKGRVRDILVYYRSPTEIDLFCILRDANDRDAALDWIDSVAYKLADENHIVVTDRQAEDAGRTPLSVIETYYGLDSTELSLSAENR